MKIKENLTTFIFQAVVAVLALVAMIFILISNGVAGYAFKNAVIVLFAVFSFVLSLGALFLTAYFGDQKFIRNIINLAIVVFSVICLFATINGRVITISAIFSFDAGNMVATKAVVTSIVGAVLLLVEAIVATVSQFFSNNK